MPKVIKIQMNSNLIAVKWNYQKSKTTWNSSLRKTKLWLLYQHTQQTFVLVKTYWRRLQCKIFFVFQDVLKASWRRLEGINARRLGNTSLETSWRRLEDVLEDEKCYAEDVLENKKCLLGHVLAYRWVNPITYFW